MPGIVKDEDGNWIVDPNFFTTERLEILERLDALHKKEKKFMIFETESGSTYILRGNKLSRENPNVPLVHADLGNLVDFPKDSSIEYDKDPVVGEQFFYRSALGYCYTSTVTKIHEGADL